MAKKSREQLQARRRYLKYHAKRLARTKNHPLPQLGRWAEDEFAEEALARIAQKYPDRAEVYTKIVALKDVGYLRPEERLLLEKFAQRAIALSARADADGVFV